MEGCPRSRSTVAPWPCSHSAICASTSARARSRRSCRSSSPRTTGPTGRRPRSCSPRPSAPRSCSRCSATSPTAARCHGCMPAGVAIAAIGISLAGVAGDYRLTFAVVVVSGLGVAAYHPEASRFANYVAGEKRATAMSLFSVGGNAGLALGAAIVTPLALAFGLSGTPLVAVIPLAVAVLLVVELPRLTGFRPVATTAGARRGRRAGRARPVAAVRPPDARDRRALGRVLRPHDARPAVLRRRARTPPRGRRTRRSP